MNKDTLGGRLDSKLDKWADEAGIEDSIIPIFKSFLKEELEQLAVEVQKGVHKEPKDQHEMGYSLGLGDAAALIRSKAEELSV